MPLKLDLPLRASIPIFSPLDIVEKASCVGEAVFGWYIPMNYTF